MYHPFANLDSITILFFLRKISRIQKYLSFKSAQILVNLQVTSRLDYADALLYGIYNTFLERIQKVQNPAARIVTLTRKRDHITPVLFNLHWLPANERIKNNILLITFKALSGLAPPYIYIGHVGGLCALSKTWIILR